MYHLLSFGDRCEAQISPEKQEKFKFFFPLELSKFPTSTSFHLTTHTTGNNTPALATSTATFVKSRLSSRRGGGESRIRIVSQEKQQYNDSHYGSNRINHRQRNLRQRAQRTVLTVSVYWTTLHLGRRLLLRFTRRFHFAHLARDERAVWRRVIFRCTWTNVVKIEKLPPPLRLFGDQ